MTIVPSDRAIDFVQERDLLLRQRFIAAQSPIAVPRAAEMEREVEVEGTPSKSARATPRTSIIASAHSSTSRRISGMLLSPTKPFVMHSSEEEEEEEMDDDDDESEDEGAEYQEGADQFDLITAEEQFEDVLPSTLEIATALALPDSPFVSSSIFLFGRRILTG